MAESDPLVAECAEAPAPLRDGDVFAFAYNQESWERARKGLGHGDLRWCFDGQLVCRSGMLVDTYWGLSHSCNDGRRFTLAEAQAAGDVRFVCNLNDVEKIRPEDYELYADGDAFNLSYQHGCYKHFVKRLGARKDKDRLLAALSRRVQDAHHEIERAARNLEWAVRHQAELVPRIEAGEDVSI